MPGAGALFAGDRALERAAVMAGQHACLVPVSCGQDRSEDPFSITYVLPQHRSLSTCLATTRESQRILRLRAGKRGRRRLGFGNRTAAAGGDTPAHVEGQCSRGERAQCPGRHAAVGSGGGESPPASLACWVSTCT